jgi:single-strand DNA-binding protein
MATTISGRLKKAANEFQAGESTGFGIRIGKKYYDRATKSEAWTNYEAVVFAKKPNQVDFYRNALIENAVVTITAHDLAIDSREHNGTTYLTIKMLNSQLEGVFNNNQQQNNQPTQRQQPPQQAPVNQPQPAQTTGFDDYDDDIPF